MTTSLEGRGAIVTGGSRGIGRAIVERLASEGAAVVFSYRDDEEAAQRCAEKVAAEGGTAHAVRADSARIADIEALFERAEELTGPPRVLVVNAALALATPLATVAEEDYDRVMDVNAKGTLFALQQAAKRLGNGGRVVTISSGLTAAPRSGFSAYTASKGAVEQMSRVAAQELGHRGITVNVVSPGLTDTGELFGEGAEAVIEACVSQTPLGRLGTPGDIADVVAFLCGPQARWITGANIPAAGGLI
jgi:3-oxoacyl-[acyl-carrier protein] reductase